MNDPLFVLREFMREMNAWESKCEDRDNQCRVKEEGEEGYLEAQRVGMQEYDVIFRRYCACNAQPRDFFYGVPPQYNPDAENIVDFSELSPGNVLITTEQQTGFKKRQLYRLVLEAEGWKILAKAVLLNDVEELHAPL